MNKDLKFGVNYVPSTEWFYSWLNVNTENVKADFAGIKSLGVDHIRLHLRWDLFQPNPILVPDILLDKLVDMLRIAEENGLDVYVSVFTGWMSGFWFLPNYTWDRHIITDPVMVETEEFLLDKLAERLMPEKAFKGIDLGNELNVYGFLLKEFSLEEGDAWLRHMTAYAQAKFPGKEVVLGVDHTPWFGDRNFSRSALAQTGTMTSLHTWIEYSGATKFGVYSSEVRSLPEFNVELANAYAAVPDRRVWVQEFGVTRPWMQPEQMEDFMTATMMNAARSENLWGFTWWCSHEISQKYNIIHPTEKEFGLLTLDNEINPKGLAFKRCIEAIKAGAEAPALVTGPAIVIEEDLPFEGWYYGKKYADLVDEGVHARFVLDSRSKDKEYLAARGITELITI